MKKLIKILMLLSLIMSSFIVPIKAKESSLIIQYAFDYQNIEGLHTETYFVAHYDNGEFTLSEKFKDYPVYMNNISSQSEWREIANTFASYIIADNIEADYIGTTNKDGQVIYEQVKPGLYLTLPVETQVNNHDVLFEMFLTVVDKTDTSFHVKPKYSSHEIEYDEKDYKVIKQWKDKNNINKRAKNVEIDIYKDNQLYETVILNSDNNWTYEWSYKDDGSQWHLVERNIGKDYKVSIYKDNYVFIVTNTFKDDTPNKPSTGDSTNVVFYMTLMSVSGLLCLVCALMLRKKDHD